MKDPALLDLSDDRILAAFAAVMLGASPLEPSATAREIAAMASRLAEPRPARPGDVEATRALRSVYMLSRDHEPSAPEPAAGAGRETSLRWAVLDQVLRLRHRQRAALTLRYVLGLPPVAVARVLGVSKPRAREIAEAGNARVIRAVGRRVDVSRHLRSVGSLLRAAVEEAPAPAAAEPRSVFKLLLSTIGEAPAARGRVSTAAVSLRPRPIYNVRHDPRPGSGPGSPPAVPPAPQRGGKQRRIGLAIAACVAALMFLGAFVPAALVAPTARLPLAALPVAPVVQEVSEAPPVPSAAFAVVVRAGDTLWSIAGRVLGSESRWNEIWRSNAGRLMADGTRFLDPDLIHPGWRLKLPAR
jgi:hypothetical protein